MSEYPLIEYIDQDLEGLMERFFEVSRRDLDIMYGALDEGDYDSLIRLGHTAKGTGFGYGFTGMGNIGHAIELAAKAQDPDAIRSQLAVLADYIDTVKVEFK